jgi:23S rRNA (uracil1939-C5)-methyltransferase
VSYADQLRFKQQHVDEHIQHIGGFSDLKLHPIIACETSFYYRNKMEYSFGDRRWLSAEEIASQEYISSEELSLGLHIPGRHDKILNLQECHLQDARSFQILQACRAYCLEHGFEPYNVITHQGWLRHLVIRNTQKSDQWLVNLVTYYENEAINGLIDHLLRRFPFITTIVESINDTWSPVAIGTQERIHYGNGYITDHIADFSFNIHPTTFFQTNTLQAEKLFQLAVDLADIKGGTVYDLYCGVGTISLFASKKAERVVGIELNPQSIQNAVINAKNNHIDHAFFELGDAKEVFSPALFDKYGKPDVLITDPPRAGMHPDVIEQIQQLNIPKMVYISCNSATMARDLKLLDATYHVQHLQPVDMFPQTYHVETVALLTLRN